MMVMDPPWALDVVKSKKRIELLKWNCLSITSLCNTLALSNHYRCIPISISSTLREMCAPIMEAGWLKPLFQNQVSPDEKHWETNIERQYQIT